MSLKRYTPLKRNKPLQRTSQQVSSRINRKVVSEETRKPIPKISDKLVVRNKKYLEIRNIFLKLFFVCEAQLPGCTYHATEIHHMGGRGIYLLIIKLFLPVCRNCHDDIGVNSSKAIERGLSISRYKIKNNYLQKFDSRTVLLLLQNKDKLLIIN